MQSCTADKLLEETGPPAICDSVTVTYDAHIKNIFDTGCNYSSCHDGSSLTSFGTYASLTSARKDELYKRVSSGNMPPSYASYQLTSAQIDSITCWKIDGFSEK